MHSGFFDYNRQRIAAEMTDQSLLILFSGKPPRRSADASYQYHPNRNFYYLTGIAREGLVLLMAKTDNNTEASLFRPNPASNSQGGSDKPLQDTDAKQLSGIQTVHDLERFDDALSRLLRMQRIDTIYFDFDRYNMPDDISLEQRFANDLKMKYPFIQTKSIYPYLASMRRVKADEEIDEVKRAIELTRRGIERMMIACKPGMREYELEAEFRYVAIKAGERDMAFEPIIASGKNAFIGHYSANNSIIQADDFVLVDVGAQSNLYHADISRVFPASGRFSDRQKLLYQAALDILKEVIARIGPGLTRKDSEQLGSQLMRQKLDSIGLKPENSQGLSWYGGVNHSIGLDTHDVGSYEIPFQAGMVVAAETAITIPEEGIAFRIEDDLLITSTGCLNLSASMIREIDDIETLMARSSCSC